MKLETALEQMRIWIDRAGRNKKGFSVEIHVGPDQNIIFRKPITIRTEEELNRLNNIIFE